MAAQSPLNPLHQQAEAAFLVYGVAGGARPEAQTCRAEVVETFGEPEGEYAAIRKACALFDLPQRGTIRLTGLDRLDFLNRMATQDLSGLNPFRARRTFWLNRKGRIDADMRLIELPEETLADLDILSVDRTAKSLGEFIITEDVHFSDETARMHRLALHGPTAAALLAAVGETAAGPRPESLQDGEAAVLRIAGRRVIVDRCDTTGEVGLELLVNVDDVKPVYEQLLERGLETNGPARDQPLARGGYRLRPAGWAAYNIARIEAGTPIYNIDFGPESLPAETGILDQRVSFTKGCFLGQEVVARMRSLGHPKQTLVGLRVNPTPEQSASGRECQPRAGAAVFADEPGEPTAVGAVTSSTRSPMLGDAVVAFAQVKWGSHEPGTRLLVESDAGLVPAVVHAGLRFWSRPRE